MIQFKNGIGFAIAIGAASAALMATPSEADQGDLSTSVNYMFEQEDGEFVDADRHGVTVNSSYDFTDRFGLGLLIGYSSKEFDFGPDVDVMSYSLAPRVKILDNLSAFAAISYSDIDVKLATGPVDTDSLSYLGGAAFGYGLGDLGFMTWTASYSYSEIDPDGIRPGQGNGKSLSTWKLAPTIGVVAGPVTWTAGVAYRHRNRDVVATGDDDTFRLKLGAKFALTKNWMLNSSVARDFDSSSTDRWSATLGLSHKVNLF